MRAVSINIILMIALSPSAVRAQDGLPVSNEYFRGIQRQQQAEKRLLPPADIRAETALSVQPYSVSGTESPCVVIRSISLPPSIPPRFKFLTRTLPKTVSFTPGMCLGAGDLQKIQAAAQNLLIGRGWVTSHASVEPQAADSGVLMLTVIPGRVGSLNIAENGGDKGSRGRVSAFARTFPVKKDAILNLRDLEQGLENLRRLPGTEISIRIEPAGEAGASNIVIDWRQQKPVRLDLGIDDSGSRTTGKYQGNIAVSFDNPLDLGDLFYVGINRDLGRYKNTYIDENGTKTGSGTHGGNFHYSVPAGYWLFAANHYTYRYHEATEGYSTNYDYNGKSSRSDLSIGRTVYRDGCNKTTVAAKIWRKSVRKYIDDIEIDVQRDRSAGWTAGVRHRLYRGGATIRAGLEYKRGTGMAGGLADPETYASDDTSETPHVKVVTADLSVDAPFRIGRQVFSFDSALHMQWSRKPLAASDKLSVGGRYTVRGFDGEQNLTGDRGFYWQNSLHWHYAPRHRLYLGLDTGRVSDAGEQYLPHRRLTGAAAGLGGSLKAGGVLSYDIFAGSIASTKGGIHLEAAKPHWADESSEPNDADVGGSLNAAKNIAVLAEGRLKTDIARIQSAQNLHLHTGKDLELAATADTATSVQNIGIKSGGTVSLVSAGKTLSAAKNIDIEAGSIRTAAKSGLKAGGNLTAVARIGDITLGAGNSLSSGSHTELSSLKGKIVSDGIKAEAGGHLSILAAGDAEYKDQTAASRLSGKGGVYTGSVGKGRLKTNRTDIEAGWGDVMLQSGGTLELGDGRQRSTIGGNRISVSSRQGGINIGNTHLNAKNTLDIHAARALSITGSRLDSGRNMQLDSDNETITLDNFEAHSARHLIVSAYGRHSGKIMQNDKKPTKNTLTAQGVLSLGSRYTQVLDNTTLHAGALTIRGTNLYKRGKIDWRAGSGGKVMQENGIKALTGRLNIEAKGDAPFTIEPGNKITADGDLTLKSGGQLRMTARSGSRGSPSAQVSELAAKGNITLTAASTDIDAARIAAGKNLQITATQGTLGIGAVKNTLNDYIPAAKVEELKRDMAALDAKITAERKTNAKSPRIVRWQQEKDKLAFYLQAVNKTIVTKETHRPHGYEYRGSLLSGQDISLTGAQGIKITGSEIKATGRLDIDAAGILPDEKDRRRAAVWAGGIADSYEIGRPTFKSHYDKAVLDKPTRLEGGKGIRAAAEQAGADIVLNDARLNAPSGNIDLNAYGSVLLESGENNAYTFRKTKGKHGKIVRKTRYTYDTNHLIMPAPTELESGGNINIRAGSNIDAYTTRFHTPKGRTNLTAGEEINLLAEEGIHDHKHRTEKGSRFIGLKIKHKNYSRRELTETKIPVRVIAQGINTQSGWNTVLEGTEFSTGLQGAVIEAGVGDKARSDAKIILKGITATVNTEARSESKSSVWQRIAGSGSRDQSLQLPKFEGPTPPVLTAPGGYIADIPKGRLKDEIGKLSGQPQYAYLKQLQTAKNTDWNQIRLAHEQWNYKQEGLTEAGAAVIALAVAVATAGSGIGAAAGLQGASAAAADAAFSSLSAQAAVSLTNNKGDIGKTLKELGRSETVKATVIAAASAGVAQKLNAAAGLGATNAASPFADRLQYTLINAGSAAAVETAVNGGNAEAKLKQAILTALIESAQGEAASRIKAMDSGYIAHKLAHAAAGCAAAKAAKAKCRDGAIGAAVGEIVGEALLGGRDAGRLSDKEKAKITAKARLAAGVAAALGNGDVNVAAEAAGVAVKYNSLSFDRTGTDKDGYEEFDEALQACKAKGGKCSDVVKKYWAEHEKNHKKLHQICGQGGLTCPTHEELLLAELNKVQNLSDPDARRISIMMLSSDLSMVSGNIRVVDRVVDFLEPTTLALFVLTRKAPATSLMSKEAAKTALKQAGAGAALGMTTEAWMQKLSKGEISYRDLIAAGIAGGVNNSLGSFAASKKEPYIADKGSVPNMTAYFKDHAFGRELEKISEKTKIQYQGQTVYAVKRKQGSLSRGDYFYLDGQHKDHLEVFGKNGNFKFVLNLDGTLNQKKSDSAFGRKLKIK